MYVNHVGSVDELRRERTGEKEMPASWERMNSEASDHTA